MTDINQLGYSIKSQLANKLLAFSENTADLQVKVKLLELEQQVLTQVPGPQGHHSLVELLEVLEASAAVLPHASVSTALDYCDIIGNSIISWQYTKPIKGGKWNSMQNFFSKKNREESKRQKLMDTLQQSLHKLNLMANKFTADLEKDEREMASLLQKAAQVLPQSAQYQRIKTNHGILEKRYQNNNLVFQQIGMSIKMVSGQLTILQSEATMAQLNDLMPLGLEKTEQRMSKSVQNIQNMVEEAKLTNETLEAMMVDIGDVMEVPESKSSFDNIVAQQRQHQETLQVLSVQGAPQTELEIETAQQEEKKP